MFIGRAGSGAIELVRPCRHRYAGLPFDQADSIRRPHTPQDQGSADGAVAHPFHEYTRAHALPGGKRVASMTQVVR